MTLDAVCPGFVASSSWCSWVQVGDDGALKAMWAVKGAVVSILGQVGSYQKHFSLEMCQKLLRMALKVGGHSDSPWSRVRLAWTWWTSKKDWRDGWAEPRVPFFFFGTLECHCNPQGWCISITTFLLKKNLASLASSTGREWDHPMRRLDAEAAMAMFLNPFIWYMFTYSMLFYHIVTLYHTT